MRKLMLFSLFLTQVLTAQIEIKDTIVINSINGKDYVFISLMLKNQSEIKQALFLQNWRLAIQSLDYITGIPIEQSTHNRLFLIKRDSDYNNSFQGEDISGNFSEKCLKELNPGEIFCINIIVSDNRFIEYYKTGKFDLYYTTSLCNSLKLPEILGADLYNCIIYPGNSFIIIIDSSDISGELNYINFTDKNHSRLNIPFSKIQELRILFIDKYVRLK